ncbi:hypothetical protein C8R43DRAFT_1142171 [Mycena crocata]|nr:hypothetical protein C8R43DRAFT_1142171 [Mycena crocata]
MYRALRASQLFTSSTSCFRTTMATNDDSGYIYENLRAPENLYDNFKDGNITYVDLKPFIDIKWGYTNELPRQRREYCRCEYGHQQVIIWLGFFRVQRRILGERQVHDAIRALVPPVVYPCIGCSVRHREYYPLEEILAEGSGAHDSHSKSRLERRANGDNTNPSSPRCAPDYSPDVLPADRNYEVKIDLDNVRAGPPRTARQVGLRNAMDGACIHPATSAEARVYSLVVVCPRLEVLSYLGEHSCSYTSPAGVTIQSPTPATPQPFLRSAANAANPRLPAPNAFIAAGLQQNLADEVERLKVLSSSNISLFIQPLNPPFSGFMGLVEGLTFPNTAAAHHAALQRTPLHRTSARRLPRFHQCEHHQTCLAARPARSLARLFYFMVTTHNTAHYRAIRAAFANIIFMTPFNNTGRLRLDGWARPPPPFLHPPVGRRVLPQDVDEETVVAVLKAVVAVAEAVVEIN